MEGMHQKFQFNSDAIFKLQTLYHNTAKSMKYDTFFIFYYEMGRLHFTAKEC